MRAQLSACSPEPRLLLLLLGYVLRQRRLQLLNQLRLLVGVVRHRVLSDPSAIGHWQVDAHAHWLAHLVLANDQFADGIVLLLQLAGGVLLVRLQRLQDLPGEQLLVHLDVVDRYVVLHCGQVIQDATVLRRQQHLLLLLRRCLLLRHLEQELLLPLLQLAVAQLLAL